MKKQPLLENPLFIFFFSLATIVVTTLSSVHFFPILLAGIIFLCFKRALKKKMFYSLFYLVIAFLFMEYNNGFIPFSLVLLSLFTIIFIIPNLSRFVSMNNLNRYIYIIVFYLGMFILWLFEHGFSLYLIKNILINIAIDLVLFGMFL